MTPDVYTTWFLSVTMNPISLSPSLETNIPVGVFIYCRYIILADNEGILWYLCRHWIDAQEKVVQVSYYP